MTSGLCSSTDTSCSAVRALPRASSSRGCSTKTFLPSGGRGSFSTRCTLTERVNAASEGDDMGAREGIPSYVAHSAEDGRLEPLEAHLREVSEMAARFAEPLGMAELAADIGLMHDLGKYSDAFQDRVLRDGPKVDHSTAGAWELSSRGSWEGAYCVTGHHAGLPDGGAVNEGGSLGDRLHRAASGRLEDYSAYRSELSVPEEVPHVSPTFPEAWGEKEQVFSCYFAARMLFS